MPQTQTQLLADLRARLDESTPRFWLDSQLVTWLNEGLRDIQRRTQVLQSYAQTITVVPGTQLYSLPSDFQTMHRVEFVPTGATQIYPVQSSTKQELDQVWGINPSTMRSYPSFYWLQGAPGTGGPTGTPSPVKLGLYPNPSQGGILNIYYWRIPVALTTGTDNADVLEGWWDLAVLYATYKAKRKSRSDATWKDDKDEYEEKIAEMIDTTRELHDQSKFMISQSGQATPNWLYGFNDW